MGACTSDDRVRTEKNSDTAESGQEPHRNLDVRVEEASTLSAKAGEKRTYRASRLLLGKGGSAVVYAGVCEQNKQPVAIKRVLVKDETTRLALEREYETLRALPDHDRVVKVFHFEAVGDDGIIVLELVKGGTLRGLCRKAAQRRLHESCIRVYMRDCLLGLQHLHRHRVIHRDLKSDNVLVHQTVPPHDCVWSSRASATVKITDFGSCKTALHGGVLQTTVNVVGTVPYMSPEAIKGKFSQASDIWAFGITMVELATPNQEVWAHLKARDAFGLLLKIGSLHPPLHLPPVPGHLSEEGRAIILRCLAFDPRARPSCDELLAMPYFADLVPIASCESLEAYRSHGVSPRSTD
jgi:serine/threonine protein kinase